jgi:hypothetical protein
VFLEAGMPYEKVQCAIIGTGCCELLTAFVSVSWDLSLPCWEGSSGTGAPGTAVFQIKPFSTAAHTVKNAMSHQAFIEPLLFSRHSNHHFEMRKQNEVEKIK